MNKKVLDALALSLGIDAKILAQSLSSENEDENITLPTLFTQSQVDEIKTNIGKDKYDEGATASREMLFKDLSDKGGLPERVKDRDGFLNSFKALILKDAKLEPDAQVKELETSISKLQGIIAEKETEYSSLENTMKTNATKSDVTSMIPNLAEAIGLSKGEATSLFFLSHEVKEDGIYQNGNKLKDTSEKDLTLSEAVAGFVNSKGWDKAPVITGRGGGSGNNQEGQTASTLAEYEAILKEKNINVGSEEANALLKEMAKENPEILN